MEKTGPTVRQLSEFITKINWIYLLLLYIWQINTIHCFLFLFPRSLSLRLFVCVIVCFQQREPFKKRWFTLCSINRKLLYFKTPLVINRLWHSVYRVCERFQLLTKCRYQPDMKQCLQFLQLHSCISWSASVCCLFSLLGRHRAGCRLHRHREP